MNILIVGGTRFLQGGVEQFCERAKNALTSVSGHHVEHIFSNAAYLRLQSLPKLWSCIKILIKGRQTYWDCIWLQYVSFPDLLILVIGRVLGYKVLVTPHLGSTWKSQTNPILRFLSRKMLTTANGIGLLSASQALELTLPTSPARFSILTFLPKLLPFCQRSNPTANGTLRLVHAARLSKGKGSFLFIEVCAQMKRAGHDICARLIGPCDEDTKAEILSLISDRNLKDELIFLGSMSESALLSELLGTDVLIHLSQTDSFPLIVLESIGCGVFPICRDLPGARQIKQSYCGHIVQTTDVIGEVVEFLTKQDLANLRHSAALAGQRLRIDYAWSSAVAACENALATTAGKAV